MGSNPTLHCKYSYQTGPSGPFCISTFYPTYRGAEPYRGLSAHAAPFDIHTPGYCGSFVGCIAVGVVLLYDLPFMGRFQFDDLLGMLYTQRACFVPITASLA